MEIVESSSTAVAAQFYSMFEIPRCQVCRQRVGIVCCAGGVTLHPVEFKNDGTSWQCEVGANISACHEPYKPII